MPYVLDANVMNLFQKERLEQISGHAHRTIELVTQDCCIALDDGGHCQQEWLACAGGAHPIALADWIVDMMVDGNIRMFSFCKSSMYKELTGKGIPKKDHKWIRLALGSGSELIVTDDIDLFDPTRKNCCSEEKNAIKRNGTGPISKFLKKTYGVSICCPEKIDDYFERIDES
jgi:hypothetical protein